MLQRRVRADLKVYSDAVNSLERSVGLHFKSSQKIAERARLAFESASQELADHIASHKCG